VYVVYRSFHVHLGHHHHQGLAREDYIKYFVFAYSMILAHVGLDRRNLRKSFVT